MAVELIAVTCLFTFGAVVVVALGASSPWLVTVLAMPVGVSGLACVGLLFAVLNLPLRSQYLLSACVLIAVVVSLVAGRSSPSQVNTLVWSLLGLSAALALATVFYTMGLVNLTFDSYEYMTIGSIMGKEGTVRSLSGSFLQKRAFLVPLVHSLAGSGGQFYLRSFGPLITLSMIGALVYFGNRVLEGALPDGRRRVALGICAALLLTNHRVVFNAFYVNAHMLLGAWLLILVGVLWLVATDRLTTRLAWVSVPIALGISLSRPESSLVALLAVVAVLSLDRLPRVLRASLLLSIGFATVGWHGLLILQFRNDAATPLEVVAMLVVGLVCLAGGALMWRGDLRLPPRTPSMVGIGLAASVVVSAAFESDTFRNSWDATVSNLVLGEGFYGQAAIVLIAVASVAYLTRRVDNMAVLIFPVVTAIPFGFLMAHLRDGAYRVGPGDSLNRMLLHWIPLCVFTLLVMLESRPAAWTARRSPRKLEPALQEVSADQRSHA